MCKYFIKFAKLTLERDHQHVPALHGLLDRFCSCEFDYCSRGVDQRKLTRTTYRKLRVLTAGKIRLLDSRSWSATRHVLRRRRWPMAESIYSLPEYDRWHDPYSASSGVSQRQNLCFTSLSRLTGNDLRAILKIDIAILVCVICAWHRWSAPSSRRSTGEET